MKPLVHFVHGKESGPWGSKIKYLAEIVKNLGFDVESLDYSSTFDPQKRVEMLVESCKNRPASYLVGSSMGGWVALTASTRLHLDGVFLLAPAVYMNDYPPIPDKIDSSKMEVVHGLRDSLIPYQNAVRLAHETQCTLHLVNDEHRLVNSLDLLGDFLTAFLKRSRNKKEEIMSENFDINEYLKVERNRLQFLISSFEEDNGSGSSIRFALLAVASAKGVNMIHDIGAFPSMPIEQALDSDRELTFEVVLKAVRALGYNLAPSTKEKG